MRSSLTLKILSVTLAAALCLGGCSFMEEAAEPDASAAPSPTPTATPAPDGSSTGQALADTYKADHVFSLNTVQGDSFNPYTCTSTWNMLVTMLAFEPLVKTDGNFEALPNLITDWETTDGQNWTFHVDTTRKFHGGGTMTPADAVFTLEAARSSYNGRYTRRFADVVSVEAVDETAFAVHLDNYNWRFYELLNIPCVESGTGYYNVPSGTGPYMFNADLTALELDPQYPGAKDMSLKKIYLKNYVEPEDILQAFEDSLLDLVINNPTDMSSLGYSSSNLKKYVDTSNLHYLGYNMRSNIFSQPACRALVTYAIDRENIISTSLQGAAEAATLPIHPNSSLYPRSIARGLEYSQDSLQAALGAAGAMDADYDGVLELNGVRAEIVFLVCSDSTAKVAAARQIATKLREAGFLVTMLEQEYSSYVRSLQEGQYDLYYGEVRLCNDWDLSVLLSEKGELNFGGIYDSTLTGYIQTFLASNGDTLQASTETLCQYLAQNAPITAICFERTEVLYHRGVLTTINPTQENIFNDIRDWDVKLR